MDDSAGLILEGKRFMEMMRFRDAETNFRNAIASDLRSVDARLCLARLAIMKNEEEGSLKLLEEVRAIQPDHSEASALQAILSMRKGEFDVAVELLERARKLQPDLEMIYYNLAKSYRKLKKFDEAEAVARKGMELYPGNYLLSSELSYLQGRKGKVGDAIRYMSDAVEKNPTYWKGYLILGQLFLMTRNLATAIDVYLQGLINNPYCYELRVCLCNTYVLKRDYVSAYRESALLATQRKHYSDFLRLGSYAILLGKPEKAEMAFKKSIERNPNSWEGHFNLGELYYAARLFPEAKREYQLSLDKDGKSFKPSVAMGLFVLHQEKNAQAAIRYFERANELAPKRLEPLLALALALATVKDFDRAEQLAADALRLARAGELNCAEINRLLSAIKRLKFNA